MGTATVLMASGLSLPENVRGIIANCPYSSPIGARKFGGFNLLSASSVQAVSKCRIPILLIHGANDSFVPCRMSESILNANPESIRLHTFPGADHGISYLVDTDRYCRIVRALANQVLEI